MKILVVGDFHGKFPRGLNSIVKNKKIDVVVSVGDYPPFSMGKIFFEKVYGNEEKNLWDKDILGKKKYKDMRNKDYKKGESVLLKLDKIPVQVITTIGNHDHPIADDVTDVRKPKNAWEWEWNSKNHFSNFINKLKNVKRIDYSFFRFRDFVFVGARGHSFPGHVKSKAYKRSRKKLEKIFKRFSKENKKGKLIFVTHVPLYETKLDLIKAKDAHELAKNKHCGGKMFRRLVEKYQPILHLCGHVEESKGKDKVGKTVSVNCGSIHNGDLSIVEIDEKKGKVKKVEFYGK